MLKTLKQFLEIELEDLPKQIIDRITRDFLQTQSHEDRKSNSLKIIKNMKINLAEIAFHKRNFRHHHRNRP